MRDAGTTKKRFGTNMGTPSVRPNGNIDAACFHEFNRHVKWKLENNLVGLDKLFQDPNSRGQHATQHCCTSAVYHAAL